MKLDEQSYLFFFMVIIVTLVQCYGLYNMINLLYFKKYGCLGDYGLGVFSVYYLVFIIALFRAIYVLSSYLVTGKKIDLDNEDAATSGLAYDIGILTDPLDIIDKNVGKFGFKAFIEKLENNAQGFDVEEYIVKNKEAIEHLGAGADEVNGYRYIFVRELDFTFQSEDDLKFKEDKCCICVDGYKQGDFVMTLGECPHHFHWECVEAWIKKNVKCPMCMNSMRKDMLRSITALQKMMG